MLVMPNPSLFPTILLATLSVFEAKSAALISGATPSLVDRAPTWDELRIRVLSTVTGERLQRESDLRSAGRGPPHVDANLRLFDARDESDVRVTLFRDAAAWCPYCQKVWIFLEEKSVPYRVERVPLNAYGLKPAWYTRRVDGGKLPALDLDGSLHTESVRIMELIDDVFSENEPRMFARPGTPEAEQADKYLELEKELQSAWFSLVFYPVDGEALSNARRKLLDVLSRVNESLGKMTGPWFLGGKDPSVVDLQYISNFERIVASVLYWKGLTIRGRYENLDRWLEAFEKRPSYMATKSDFYTLVKSMPSQNGPGYSIPEARRYSDQIDGLGDAWKLPLSAGIEPPSRPSTDNDVSEEEAARHEAAYCLITRHERVVPFACRGAGEPGRPSFHAELADPCAEPDEDFVPAVDTCLRHVALALLDGADMAELNYAKEDLAGQAGDGELREGWGEYEDDDGRAYYWNEITGDVTWIPPTFQLDTCLAYLRDRIGVPRDMNQVSAMQLRAHLNWAIDLLQ